MLSLQPPYRLETYQSVRSFLPPKPNDLEKKLLRFAKKHSIVKPPILSFIPNKYDIIIYELKKNIYWKIEDVDICLGLDEMVQFIGDSRSLFIEAVSDMRSSYFEIFEDININGAPFLEKRKREHYKTISISTDYPGHISAGLQNQTDAYQLLVNLFKKYLSTRNRALKNFLIKSFLQIVSFIPQNHQPDTSLIERLRSLPATSTLVLNDLHTLFCERLERIQKNIFAPHCYQLIRLTKNRITKIEAPSNVKRNFIDLLDLVRSQKDIRPAQKKIDNLFRVYQERLSPETLQRIHGIIENFFEKLTTFENFFDHEFSTKKIHKAYDLFCKKLRTQEISTEAIAIKTLLTLYPCKDYHDFLKGIYSSDCTKDNALSAEHLSHPRFFNIRIFKEDKWIGCIYCLDYSDRNVVIIDRVQLENSTNLMPIQFFPTFMKQMVEHLQVNENLKILGPSSISNFKSIQSSYDNYCAGRKREEFPLGSDERIFACAQQKLFYVLS